MHEYTLQRKKTLEIQFIIMSLYHNQNRLKNIIPGIESRIFYILKSVQGIIT